MSAPYPPPFRLHPAALALSALLLLATAPEGLAQPSDGEAVRLGGRAAVLDGDTLEIAGERVRLEGIDAPEAEQTCGDASRTPSRTWACGQAATRHLRRLIGSRRVVCEGTGRDTYGRVLGLCTVDGRDLNAEMVRSGHAWAFVRYSTRYQALEAAARTAKAGIWAGDAEPAWAFRQRQWTAAAPNAPKGCAIKGNVSANGHIYHMPWSPWYGKVRIEPEKGERWFCSEAEAVSAGFRPAVGD